MARRLVQPLSGSYEAVRREHRLTALGRLHRSVERLSAARSGLAGQTAFGKSAFDGNRCSGLHPYSERRLVHFRHDFARPLWPLGMLKSSCTLGRVPGVANLLGVSCLSP